MIVFTTEVTITDHPEYTTPFSGPTAIQQRAKDNVTLALTREMDDEGETHEIITADSGHNQISMTYEGCLNTYYITAYPVG